MGRGFPDHGGHVVRNEVVDASIILELLTLGVPQGSKLALTVKGPDAKQVLDAVVEELAKDYEQEVRT